ncbi:malic enzyme-like NAD(P)-binding protein [Streptomyces sp. NPDC002520]
MRTNLRCFQRHDISLLETVRHVEPTMLLGTSTVAGAFTQDVIETMAAGTERPIIFPLSDPATASRCHACGHCSASSAPSARPSMTQRHLCSCGKAETCHHIRRGLRDIAPIATCQLRVRCLVVTHGTTGARPCPGLSA